MKKICLFIGLAALCLSACQKTDDLEDNVDGAPVFSVNFDNSITAPTVIQAGVGGYYLFTDYALLGLTPQQTLQQSSAFAPADCPTVDCPGTVQFVLEDFNAIDSTAALRFKGPDSAALIVLYRSTFVFQNLEAYATATLYVNGTSTTFNPDLTTEITKESTNGGLQMVELVAGLDSGLLDVNVAYYQSIEPQNASAALIYPSARFSIEKNQGIYNFNAYTQPNWQYTWSTGDTLPTFTQDSIYLSTYGLTVTNPNNNAQSGVNIVGLPPNTGSFSSPYFSYTTELVADKSATIVIRQIAADGTVWSSDLQAQPADASCEYILLGPWENNEKGQKTRKVQLNFNCLLFNTAGEQQFVGGSAVVAVAYP